MNLSSQALFIAQKRWRQFFQAVHARDLSLDPTTPLPHHAREMSGKRHRLHATPIFTNQHFQIFLSVLTTSTT